MALKEAFTIGVVLSAKDMYSRMFGKAQTDLKRLSRTAKDEAAKYERSLKFGKRMAVAGGLVTAAAYGISKAFEGMKESAVDLDQAVADVSTVMSDLDRRVEFRARALEASSKSMFNASQILREGAYNLLSAGLSEDEALAILPRVAQLAMGTFDDVAGATNNATTVMMAYKSAWKDLAAEEKAIKTTDALARAIQLFKYVGPELSTTLQYSAAAAAAANVKLEDMLATVGVMKSAGLEASMAGTSYRMMLEKLPDVHKKTGIAIKDTTGRMRPLVEILKALKKRYGDVLTVAELEEISDMFDVRAAGGVKALILNLDDLVKKTGEMNKAGAAWEMYERRMAGAGAQMQALRNEYEESSATLAMKMLPVMRKKQELLTRAVKTIERIPAAKEVLAGADLVAELGKLAGPLLTAIGLWRIYHTQQKIAIALQTSLNASTTGTAVAAGAKGAAAAGAGAAGRGLLGTLTGAAGIGAALWAGIYGLAAIAGGIGGFETSRRTAGWRGRQRKRATDWMKRRLGMGPSSLWFEQTGPYRPEQPEAWSPAQREQAAAGTALPGYRPQEIRIDHLEITVPAAADPRATGNRIADALWQGLRTRMRQEARRLP